MFFMVYIDLGNQIIPGGMTPFLTGAVCANLAWLTIWPLDVVKSQRQSGNFENHSAFSLLRQAANSGKMYRGLLPGLARSSIANGCSMSVYVKVKNFLEKEFDL